MFFWTMSKEITVPQASGLIMIKYFLWGQAALLLSSLVASHSSTEGLLLSKLKGSNNILYRQLELISNYLISDSSFAFSASLRDAFLRETLPPYHLCVSKNSKQMNYKLSTSCIEN